MVDHPLDLGEIRATRAYVDLDAIAGNVRELRRALPETTELMAVVKADAYGHGAPLVARVALEAGATLLGVATVDEGACLRAAGIAARIVLLGSIDASETRAACRSGLEITVAGVELLEAVQRAARDLRLPAPIGVHLKIDTGLRRYGALPEQAAALAARIGGDACLRFAGVCTHFASADEPAEPFTGKQLRWFEDSVAAIRDSGIPIPARHAANSAGVLTGQGIDLEIARPGIALYGIPPSPEVPLLAGMRPALRVQSRVARLVPLAPGETVGYNRTFRAERAGLGALIPIGYADGFRRSLSGRGWVGLHGRESRVLGRVSMDQIVVEVPAGTDARVGDVVHILGGEGAPSALELADLMETNAYEVLVGIRQRVPRVFIRGGQPIAVRVAGAGGFGALPGGGAA